ncbi:MAG: SRPBCC domain-containing protein [Pseudomonadota bacterium]
MSEASLELKVEKTFAADIATVYAALTDPAMLQRWMAPGRLEVVEAVCQPVVGGQYRIVMHDPEDGSVVATSGTFEDVRPPVRLAHTWQWDGTSEVTRVCMDLVSLPDGGTLLTLTHSRFEDAARRISHGEGWEGCLQKLAALLDMRRI